MSGSRSFSPKSGMIFVEAQVSGSARAFDAKLILDTGSSITTLSPRVLRLIGYDLEATADRVHLTAGFGSATVPRLMLNRLTALGRHAIGLRVVAHDLPPEAGVDGLLGLDFFRDLTLTIDFRAGQITLA